MRFRRLSMKALGEARGCRARKRRRRERMVWLELRLEGEARSSGGGGQRRPRILATPDLTFFVHFHSLSSIYLQLLSQLSSGECPDF